MAKNKYIWLLILVSNIVFVHAQGTLKIRRVCKSNQDNSIFFTPSDDPCTKFRKYYVWGRNGGTGPYVLLDSIDSKTASQYLHANANPAGNPTKWSYFIEYTDSCSTTPGFSDTVAVDENPPEIISLDSVSVDITINKVILGWKGNKSPDFSKYVVYRDSTAVFLDISNGGIRDTFITDNRPSSDPRLGSLTYDITSYDSCNLPQIFGFNPHKTIYLSGLTDTCKRQNTLNWTPYIGWSAIRNYQVYKKTNAGGFVLIATLPAGINTYTDNISLGDINDYYVRAFKDTSVNISSTSSMLTIQTRARKDPLNTYLSSVDALDPDGSQLELRFQIKPNEEAKSVSVYRANESDFSSFSAIAKFPVNSKTGNLSGSIVVNKTDLSYYTLISNDLCDLPVDTSNMSPNIRLNILASTEQNELGWNSYFGWDNNVALYRIFRGTDIDGGTRTYSILDSTFDTIYIDKKLPEQVGSFGLCYYIEAVQNPGSLHGITEVARSFSYCVIGDFVVYIPNAFNPDGYNQVFRPEGSYIDYANSSVEIFDRWGSRIISFSDLTKGWDGKDGNGRDCMQGVYYYKMKIKSANGQETLRTGIVTLLN